MFNTLKTDFYTLCVIHTPTETSNYKRTLGTTTLSTKIKLNEFHSFQQQQKKNTKFQVKNFPTRKIFAADFSAVSGRKTETVFHFCKLLYFSKKSFAFHSI